MTKNSGCAPAHRSQWPSHVRHSQRFLPGKMPHWIQSPAQCLEWLQLQACLKSFCKFCWIPMLLALICRVQEQLLQLSEHGKTSSAIPGSHSSGIPPNYSWADLSPLIFALTAPTLLLFLHVSIPLELFSRFRPESSQCASWSPGEEVRSWSIQRRSMIF